jgi:hypothetical protein
LHAINYLLGDLDESYLSTLRAKGGTVDFSTGSVGIGATAALWAAMAHRYIASQFPGSPPAGRFVSLPGDAELDEGAIWEAVADPAVAHLGELLWVVDLNRQSLDRVVPDIQIQRLQGMFRRSRLAGRDHRVGTPDQRALPAKRRSGAARTAGEHAERGIPADAARAARRDRRPHHRVQRERGTPGPAGGTPAAAGTSGRLPPARAAPRGGRGRHPGRRGRDHAETAAAAAVTVLDGHPHTLAFLAGVRGDRIRCLGVTEFGQSSDLDDAYRIHRIDTGSIVDAALTLVGR